MITKTVLFLAGFLSLAWTQPAIFETSARYPFGRPNPVAPEQLRDFEEMIGICECESIRRNPDGTWQDTLTMIWKFKYILNGMAIQDETWNEDSSYSISIRQFNKDSLNWVVTFYNSRTVRNSPGTWLGNRKEDTIVLNRPQKSPSGMDGISRLTFYDISDDGFKWKGEWLDLKEQIVYPFWTIQCRKVK